MIVIVIVVIVTVVIVTVVTVTLLIEMVVVAPSLPSPLSQAFSSPILDSAISRGVSGIVLWYKDRSPPGL